jgi:hypothetical protein
MRSAHPDLARGQRRPARMGLRERMYVDGDVSALLHLSNERHAALQRSGLALTHLEPTPQLA